MAMLFWVVAGLLFLSYLLLGYYSMGRKDDLDDYFLAGRELTFPVLALSIAATQLGGGAFVASAEAGYEYGWQGLNYVLGMSLGLLAMGLVVGKKLHALGIATIAEIYTTVYKAPKLRYVAAILSAISLFVMLIGQMVASKGLFESGNFHTTMFLFFWVVVILYTVMGGFKAVVFTDVVQTSFIILIFVTAFILSPIDLKNLVATNSFKACNKSIINFFIFPFLSMCIGQDTGQRCFSAKNKKTVKIAFILATFAVLFTGLIPLMMGVYAKTSHYEASGGVNIILHAVNNQYISSLISIAIFVAIVSTADSLLCAFSSNIALDFKKFPLYVSRLITLIAGILALVATFFCANVLAIFLLSYQIYLCSLAVPTLFALFAKKWVFRRAATVSLFSGIMGVILEFFFTFPISNGIFALGLSLFGYVATALFLKNPL